MRRSGLPLDGDGNAGLLPAPYDLFMRSHLSYYGFFRGQELGEQKSPVFPGDPTKVPSTDPGREPSSPGARDPSPRRGAPLPLVRHRGSTGPPPAVFALPSAQGPPPAPRWPIECEVIKEPIQHIEWVPPEPEPFCQPAGPEPSPDPAEEQGTIVYQLSPAPPGSRFTRARAGGAPGPLSSPAAALAGVEDTALLFESRFESGNLQRALRVGPFEYVLTLRPDLYTTKHTQWFYFRVQNTRKDHTYRFTIANLAKPKSLYGAGMQPLFYSQRDAQSRGIGWRRIGVDVRYYRGGGGEEPPVFHLSWTFHFPHDADTCFFAHSYPYTYTELQHYLWALARDPQRSQYCAVRALCHSLAGNTVFLLTITSPGGTAGKRAVVLSARAHPGETGGSWAMQGFLDFLLSAHADARLLRRLFLFKVVPMLNPDGVVVGNSRCSLAGRDPNRAYGMADGSAFPGVWHLRALVERVLAEREVVLYCDFHGHSRKNNVFMYGCDGSGVGTAMRRRQRVFPLMLSKNAPDKFSFPSCKFQVQRSKAGTGRVVLWHLGVSNSYTMEVAFGGSTLGGRSSHFTVEDLKSLGYHLCDTLLDFCDPDPTKFQQCLVEVDALLRQRVGREQGSGGGWSEMSPSELESSTSGSDSSVSDGSPELLHGPARPVRPQEQRRRKRLRSRRARNALRRTNAASRSRGGAPARLGPSSSHQQPAAPNTPSGDVTAGAEPRGGTGVALPRTPGAQGGLHGTTERSQPGGGTSVVARQWLSTSHRGGTGDSQRDEAPRAGTRPRWGQGGQGGGGQRGQRRGQEDVQVAAAPRRRPRVPLTATGRAPPRCCACARN